MSVYVMSFVLLLILIIKASKLSQLIQVLRFVDIACTVHVLAVMCAFGLANLYVVNSYQCDKLITTPLYTFAI
jgi:hypothetical protein